MLIEIHMLKNYGPSNLNRDDTGSPKSCIFGSVQRGRISSQCLKRSWRKSEVLMKEIGKENIGIRTRKLPELVADELKEMNIGEDYIAAAKKKLTGIANKEGKLNKDGDFTSQVIIYSPEDIAAVSEIVAEKIKGCASVAEFDKITAKDLEKAIAAVKIRPVSLDIALFGRMVTSDAFSNVEAAMQVAHAVSTNKVMMETDFFTAVDDLIDGTDENGSGMMGDIDYNSSCYYIYASIDTDKLLENLKNSENADILVKQAIPALVKTMAFSNPSGKQNSFAGHSLPSAVMVECREYPVPISYVNAFVKPACASRDVDLITNSIDKLVKYVEKTDAEFGIPLKKRLWFCSENTVKIKAEENKENCNSFPKLIDELSKLL